MSYLCTRQTVHVLRARDRKNGPDRKRADMFQVPTGNETHAEENLSCARNKHTEPGKSQIRDLKKQFL